MRSLVLLSALCATLPSAVGQVPPFAGFETQSISAGSEFGDNFGFSMDRDGDWLLIGMPTIGPTSHPGAVGAYLRSGELWQLVQVINDPTMEIGGRFGFAVGVSGDTAVIGADRARGDGRAFVFHWSGTTWELEATLAPNDGSLNARFGQEVAVDGDLVVVGDADADAPSTGSNFDYGAAYVYERSGSSWPKVAKLSASDGEQHARFGESLAVEGATILAGARSDGDLAGAVYVFEHAAGAWVESQKLLPQATTPGGEFGTRLALDGERACIAADHDADAASTAGVVSVFERVGGVWVEGKRLTSPEEDGGYGFGLDVDLHDGLLVVAEAGSATRGLAHVYYESAPGQWDYEATMQPSASEPGDTNAGLAVTVGPEPCVAIGAGSANDHLGVVYSFDLLPIGAWIEAGFGVPGQAGAPSVTGTGYLVANTQTVIELTDARPLAISPLVVGAAALQAPFKGGVLYPSPDLILYMFTDFQGEADLAFLWPPGIPSGVSIYLQWWVQDPAGPVGYSATAGLAATAP